MSPASLRRYRAERLLREQFRSLRASVIASTRTRLRACGAQLDDSDLEACYAQAWQGLYAATLEGQPVLSPAGWLAVVTFRRAIDEHRARTRFGLPERPGESGAAGEPPERAQLEGVCCALQRDAAIELDERIKLRHLFEALRLRMSEREQQAAALCYLQGLTRAQAATTMGVSAARMRKLMEGSGRGRPGVAAKMAALADTIARGEWCAEQGSLMRGLAYGVLDPEGQRHRAAIAHTAGCPACRAYVASLRGLAALLPPTPSLLPLLAAGGAGGATATGGALSAPAVMSSGGAASGAAGAGAAGGGWLLASGGVGAKLAAGCLLALGVGAGCAVLGAGRADTRASRHAHAARHAARPLPSSASLALLHEEALSTRASTPTTARATSSRVSSPMLPTPAARATREFGPERLGAGPGTEAPGASHPRLARAPALATAARATGEFAPTQTPPAPSGATAQPHAAQGSSTSAQREFSPG
jgi:DNA-directed RNA polymerase specialized sigma24 family protein